MTIEYGTKPRMYKLLFHWYGSAWKAIYKELLVWLLAYYIIRFGIMFGCPTSQMGTVRGIIKLFDTYTSRIPLEFLLGFYVNQIVARWWNQILALVSPTEIMSVVTTYIPGNDEDSRRSRHTVARFLLQFYTVAYRNVSKRMKKLFPNNDKFVDMGLMTQEESIILEKLPPAIAHEQPLQWAQTLIREKAGNHGRIIDALNKLRGSAIILSKHGKFQLPLVYTQTVTIIVYGFFLFSLISSQYFNAENIDIYFPFYTVLRFIFTVGWLKVAEDLFYTFGNDDEDIDLCATLSGYTTIAYTIANMPENGLDRNLEKEKDEGQMKNIKTGFDANVLVRTGVKQRIREEVTKICRHRSSSPSLL